MNLDKVISQLESKETLLIFLRDNYPDVLEKWKNKVGLATNQTSEPVPEQATSGVDQKSQVS